MKSVQNTSMESYLSSSSDYKLGSELSGSPHKEATKPIVWSFQVCNPGHDYLGEYAEFYFNEHSVIIVSSSTLYTQC